MEKFWPGVRSLQGEQEEFIVPGPQPPQCTVCKNELIPGQTAYRNVVGNVFCLACYIGDADYYD